MYVSDDIEQTKRNESVHRSHLPSGGSTVSSMILKSLSLEWPILRATEFLTCSCNSVDVVPSNHDTVILKGYHDRILLK